MKKTNTLTRVLRVGGLLLLAAALLLAGHNLWQQKQSNQAAQDALEELYQQRAAIAEEHQDDDEAAADDTKENETADDEEVPAYELNPDMEMPMIMAGNLNYIGILHIHSLNLYLPVISDWDYQKLNIAPCRYYGSAYQGNLVIAAHNYSNHFGKLERLKPGDAISLEDMDGNVFQYVVAATEQLDGTAVEEMTGGGWDLTLFTCTLNGQARVTIRCNQV